MSVISERAGTRLASSNGRLLELEALNPKPWREDKLPAPQPEFPGVEELAGAGTSLSSQTESLLESGAGVKTKTNEPDDNPVPFSNGSGTTFDLEEDATMRAKVPDCPEAGGQDIIDLPITGIGDLTPEELTGDHTDKVTTINRRQGPAKPGKDHTNESKVFEPPRNFQQADGLPQPSSNLTNDGEILPGNNTGNELAAAGCGECMATIDEGIGTIPDARRVPSFATIPSIGNGSQQSSQLLSRNTQKKVQEED